MHQSRLLLQLPSQVCSMPTRLLLRTCFVRCIIFDALRIYVRNGLRRHRWESCRLQDSTTTATTSHGSQVCCRERASRHECVTRPETVLPDCCIDCCPNSLPLYLISGPSRRATGCLRTETGSLLHVFLTLFWKRFRRVLDVLSKVQISRRLSISMSLSILMRRRTSHNRHIRPMSLQRRSHSVCRS